MTDEDLIEDPGSGMSREEGIRTVYGGPNHVVILGAGASIASARHNPEPSGKKLPSMGDFIEVVGLDDILTSTRDRGNFEATYSRLYLENPNSPTILEINDRVSNYFGSLCLPDAAVTAT